MRSLISNNDLPPKSKRVKTARMLSGLTRKDVYEKYGIHPNTLKSWESSNPYKKGLSIAGAKRYAKALRNEGIIITEEWLLFGRGKSPSLKNNLEFFLPEEIFIEKKNEIEKILFEINFLIDSNFDFFVMAITDDSMEPFFSVGDYIGGRIIKKKNDFKNYISSNCIVCLGSIYLVRRFAPTIEEKIFTIYPINSKNGKPLKVKIDYLVPVFWHRRISSKV